MEAQTRAPVPPRDSAVLAFLRGSSSGDGDASQPCVVAVLGFLWMELIRFRGHPFRIAAKGSNMAKPETSLLADRWYADGVAVANSYESQLRRALR